MTLMHNVNLMGWWVLVGERNTTRGWHYYTFLCPTPLFSCPVDIHLNPVAVCESKLTEYVTICLHYQPQVGWGLDWRCTHQEEGGGIQGGVHHCRDWPECGIVAPQWANLVWPRRVVCAAPLQWQWWWLWRWRRRSPGIEECRGRQPVKECGDHWQRILTRWMQSGPARGSAWGGNESLRMSVLIVPIAVHGGTPHCNDEWQIGEDTECKDWTIWSARWVLTY